MNNHRLLTVLLSAALSGSVACSYAQTVYSLEDIFEAAESASVQLKPYFTATEEAVHAIGVARNARLPEISTSLSLSYIGDGTTTKRNLTDWQKAPIPHLGTGLSVEVSQPLYSGGVITNSIEIAGLKSAASRYAGDMQRDDLRFRLTGFYLDLYRYHNLRDVAVSNISAAEKVLAEMNARYEQGTLLKNDITRYELLLTDLHLQLTRIDNTLRILNDNLVTLSGLPEGTSIVPDTTLTDRCLPLEGQEWWLSEAENNAPSIAVARTGVEISKRGEAITQADRLPKIGLKAGLNFDGPILVEVPPINRNLGYWYVGVGVSYNLSSLYKANKSLDRSRAATRRSVEMLEATRQNISLGVRADYIKYMEAYEDLKSREKGLELAERNYQTTSTRFTADMALLTDMLDAANARLDAGTQLVNARINIIYYYYKLLFTSGKI